MAGISVTDQYDALLTTTARRFENKLRDQIFEPMRTLNWLMKTRGKGRSVGTFDLVDGGYQIGEQLMYAKNTTFDWKSAYGAIDTTPQEGLTVALYDWVELGGSITISKKEERQNSGASRLLSLLEAKMEQAKMSAKDTVSTALFATSQVTTKVNSLLHLIQNDPTTSSTIGSLNQSTYSWWRNAQNDVGAFTANLYIDMNNMFNTLSKDGAPDGIVCSQGAYEYYTRLAGDGTIAHLRRITDEKKSLDLGFEVLKFRNADLWFDFDLPTGAPVTGDTMLFLNSKWIRFVLDRESNFKISDFMRPHDQTARTAIIHFMGQLCTSKRRALGILHGIDAS